MNGLDNKRGELKKAITCDICSEITDMSKWFSRSQVRMFISATRVLGSIQVAKSAAAHILFKISDIQSVPVVAAGDSPLFYCFVHYRRRNGEI